MQFEFFFGVEILTTLLIPLNFMNFFVPLSIFRAVECFLTNNTDRYNMLLSVFVKQVFGGFCGKTLGTDETVETIIIPIAVLPFDVVSHIVFVHCLVVT